MSKETQRHNAVPDDADRQSSVDGEALEARASDEAARIRQLEAALAESRAQLQAETEARRCCEQEVDAIYQETFHRNTAPKLLIDPDNGAIVDANSAAQAFYGYTLDVFRQQRIQDINQLSDAEVQAEWEKARQEQRRYFEFRHRLANGELRDVKVYSGPVVLGGKTYLHSIVHDVTEAWRYRHRLERYKAIFDALPIGVYRNRPGFEGPFEAINPAMARIFGAESVGELLAHPAAGLYRDAEQRRHLSEALRVRGELQRRELAMQTLDGRTIRVAISARMRPDEAGEPVIDGIVEDITERHHAEQERAQILEILEATSDLIGMADLNGNVLYQNAALRAFAGARFQQRGWDLRALLPEEAARQLREEIIPLVEREGSWQGETTLLDAEGRSVPVSQTLVAHRDERGRVQRYSTIMRDISAERSAEVLRRKLLESLAEGVFGIDHAGRITFVNPAGCGLLGLADESEALGRNAHALFHHSRADGEPLLEANCRIAKVQHTGTSLEAWEDWFWRQDGSGFPVEVFAAPLSVRNHQADGMVVAFTDISQRKAMQQELERLATRDPLTGIYNRARLYELLDQSRAELERHGTPFSVIMLDIDRFKAVNDRYGHQAGDEVLRELTGRLNDTLRETDKLGRWGGEEFLVLAPHTDAPSAETLAERLRRVVAQARFERAGPLTISLGVATCQAGEQLEQLEERVDQAMYAAKQAGRNRVVADPR